MEESLCYTCRSLNFEQIFRERREPSPIFWPVSGLVVWSKYCPFCRLLLSVINSQEIQIPNLRDYDWTIGATQVPCAKYCPSSRPDIFANSIAIQARSAVSRLGSIIGFPLGHPASLELPHPYSKEAETIYKLRVQIWKDVRVIYPRENSDTTQKIHCIHLLTPRNETNPKAYLINFRAIVPDRVDFHILNGWLRKCEHSHSNCGLLPETTDLPVFRLIDVQKECLVKGALAWRYLALSYVWGSAPRLTLTLRNEEALYLPGCLSSLNHDIPRTIRDTFVLCKQLKERYVWVDSLCIIQDSAIDKYAQIAHMDEIYHSALLTMVGAAGDASTGLPGVADTHRQTTQIVASVQHRKFSTAADTINDLLASSPWSFRGWTLQEQILSRRLLVFTDQMVFFNCQEAIFREDIEPRDATGNIVLMDPAEKSVLRPHGSLSNITPSSNQPTPAQILSALDEYAELVHNYMNRSLSNEEDILNAFTGVLKTFIPTLGVFRFGLPLNYLGVALLWELQGKSIAERRKEVHIPSWSWAAWTAKKFDIYFPIESYSSVVYPLIHIFEFKDTDRVSSLSNDPISIPILPKIVLDNKIEEHCKAFEQDELHQIKRYKLTSPLYKYLIFWTSVAMLQVRAPLMPFEPPEGDTHSYDICDHNGECIGWVFLSDSWRKTQPKHLEFILVGALEQGQVYFRTIIVERRDGVARRVQMTTLKQTDWLAAKPERKLILLA